MADSDTDECMRALNITSADITHPENTLATNSSIATQRADGRACESSPPANNKATSIHRDGGRSVAARCRVRPLSAPNHVEDEGCGVPPSPKREPIKDEGCRDTSSQAPRPVEDADDFEVRALAFSLVHEISEVNRASSETAKSEDSPPAIVALGQSSEVEPCNASPRSDTSHASSVSKSPSHATQVLSRDASPIRSKSPSKRLSSAQEHDRGIASKRAKVTEEPVIGDNVPVIEIANPLRDTTNTFVASLPEGPRQCAGLQQACLEMNEVLDNLKRKLTAMDSTSRSEGRRILTEIKQPIFDLPTAEKTVHVLEMLRSAAETRYAQQREHIVRLHEDNVALESSIQHLGRAVDELLDISPASPGNAKPTQIEEDSMSSDGSTMISSEGEDRYTSGAAVDMKENNEPSLDNRFEGNGAVIPELVVTQPNYEGKQGLNVTANRKTIALAGMSASNVPASNAAMKDTFFNRTAIPGAVILTSTDKNKALRMRRMSDVPSTTVESSGIDRFPRTHHVSFIVGYRTILEPVWLGPSNEPKALSAVALANEQIKATHPNCLEAAQKQFSCLACLNFGKECASSSKDGMRIACDCCRGKGSPCIVGRQGRLVVLPQCCRLSV